MEIVVHVGALTWMVPGMVRHCFCYRTSAHVDAQDYIQ